MITSNSAPLADPYLPLPMHLPPPGLHQMPVVAAAADSTYDGVLHSEDPLLNPSKQQYPRFSNQHLATHQQPQAQQLPHFSAAESVLRFLAATESSQAESILAGGELDSFLDEEAVYRTSAALRDDDMLESRLTAKFAELGLERAVSFGRDRNGFQQSNGFGNYSSDAHLNDTTASVVRPFLYDAFSSKYGDDDYRPPTSMQPNYKSFRPGGANPPRYREEDDQGFRPYTAVPPPGYICKLCFVEGHWLKNCTMYRERRRDNLFMPAPTTKPRTQPAPLRPPPKTTIPPDGYVCRKCHTPGHWIQQCSAPHRHSVPPEGYTCKVIGSINVHSDSRELSDMVLSYRRL
ncbi:uncharacterized protein SPPG_04837 [Spizellomyces punctatus DAOM BR117]|uniref:CCHC-type domain-containing protein n=1 Tax=Spizellomyces punctatus (strain DAOM BR117) TaxID=645134 RepID=A0A0L0HHG9_SPIPD|nr:uncharacterized protein SPPG_04837 [Spizellomyces punctatus DAOM BR117]KND00527.1 hypothetical protein SPPG_04837 [Spizellomyces punctatus DAOM BR117]|eukprot:XP_016608566.1 hypothetical protein SPPG_04837 [Spizellomyces punctatus DAOM BR117]